MKRVLLIGVSTLLLALAAGQAAAADLGTYSPAPYTKAPAFNPVYNWTGFYLGINGGGAFGRSTWDTAGTFDTSGGLIGGTAGYNWQTGGAWVLGLEGDIDAANINGNTINPACPLGCKTSDSWLATVRGRIGYAFDRFLPYVTGGLAVGDIKATTPGFIGQSGTNAGWTVGGGLEFAVVNNWTIKAEYLFVDLGTLNCGFNCSLAATDNVTSRMSVVRGGLNYRF